jgi:hypothetical protein
MMFPSAQPGAAVVAPPNGATKTPEKPGNGNQTKNPPGGN